MIRGLVKATYALIVATSCGDLRPGSTRAFAVSTMSLPSL